MKSCLLWHFMLLIFLSSRTVVLVKASDNTIRCGYDNCCQSMVKVVTAVNEQVTNANEIYGKQAKDLEELKKDVNRTLVSTVTISTQLEKHSADLLSHDERLKTQLDEQAMVKLMTSVNEIKTQLSELAKNVKEVATNVNEVHGKQATELEELRKDVNRSLASTAAISTQLEKHSAELLTHDERLKTHDKLQTNLSQIERSSCDPASEVCDCSDIKARGQTASGVYDVCVGHKLNRVCTSAFCDMKTTNGASLVFQRRKDGSVNFNRTWAEYKQGFGDRNGEFWLGNEMLHLLTSKQNYKLRVDLEDFEGGKRYAEYARFSISSSADNYRLTVGGYSGNAGDSLLYNNGKQFSTKDVDNDGHPSLHCAQWLGSGWWFQSCSYSILNGIYHQRYETVNHHMGILWYYWHNSWQYSLKATEMKLVPVA